MTKDGRPSRISDIRLFHGDRYKYLEGHHDALAFARRMAWYLNGEEFSLGAYPALYVLLTASLEPGVVQVTDQGGDWWQRYTMVGVPRDFPTEPGASEIAKRSVIGALTAIRSDLKTTIDVAEQYVRTHGNDLRFLLKTKQMKRYTMEISFNIAAAPQTSFLFVSLADKTNGDYLEAPPEPLMLYFEAFDLAGAIKVANDAATVEANKSISAQLVSSRHGGSLVKSISEFRPAPRPAMSKLVKRRG